MTHNPGRRVLPLVLLAVCATASSVRAEDRPAAPVPVPVQELGEKFQLVGRTGPLFKFVKVEGVVVEGPFKGYEDGPNLRVQRIAGVATQEDIRLRLLATFRDVKQGRRRAPDELEPVKLGGSYEFAGYEDGDFVGLPFRAYEEAGLPVMMQTCDVYLRTQFVPLRTKPIPPVVFGPADFVGRRALLEGTATSRDGKGFLDGPDWRLLVKRDGAWPQWMEGKPAETLATIRPGDDARTFAADEPATARLVRLEDQVGRTVELRGEACSTSEQWWFKYRGQDLYVEGQKQLNYHGEPVVVRGTLVRAMRPDLKQPAEVENPPPKEYFVVRDATWEPIDRLLAPELPTPTDR